MAPARPPQEVVKGVVDKLYDPWVALYKAQLALGALTTLSLGTRGKSDYKFESEIGALAGRLQNLAGAVSSTRAELAEDYQFPLKAPLGSSQPTSHALHKGDETNEEFREFSDRIYLDYDPVAVTEAVERLLALISHGPILQAKETIEGCRRELKGISEQQRLPTVEPAIDWLDTKNLLLPEYRRYGSIPALPDVVNELVSIVTNKEFTDKLAGHDRSFDLAAHNARFRRFEWPRDLRYGPLPQNPLLTTPPPPEEQRSAPGAGPRGSGTGKDTPGQRQRKPRGR